MWGAFSDVGLFAFGISFMLWFWYLDFVGVCSDVSPRDEFFIRRHLRFLEELFRNIYIRKCVFSMGTIAGTIIACS